ncbi:MAG: hypothetical protein ACJ8ER_12650 [Allosphingosinicella sp.]
MVIRVNEPLLEAKGRPAAISLAVYTLRAMEMWKRHVSDYDSAMIMIAVIAISAERLLRSELDPQYGPLSQAIDLKLLGKCNVTSIAHATGLNRESTRRKVNDLIKRGRLARLEDGTIFFRTGLTQESAVRELVRRQMVEIATVFERLLRLGVLDCGTAPRINGAPPRRAPS